MLQFTLDLFEPPAPAPAMAADSVAGGAEVVGIAAAFSHPHANRQVHLQQLNVGYLFQRARRRTIGLVVGPDGLVVRAPRWTPLYEVDAALQERATWIVRKLAESRERKHRQERTRVEWRDGACMPFLGNQVQVLLDPSHSFGQIGAQLETSPGGQNASVLRVGLARCASAEQIRDAVQAWLMRQARENFEQRLNQFAPALRVRWKRLILSNATTRWGSAHADGSIRLNWRLIHFRQPIVDYVVAHELSHLRVMDHSPRFWDTVREVVPDFAVLRGQLRDDAIPRW
jgi:predicted metal-dependent hydrolase